MTLTPEARAKELVIEIAESFAEGTKARDGGARWAGRYSSWADRIASAIRAAENDALELACAGGAGAVLRLMAGSSDRNLTAQTVCDAIRSLKHKD